MTNIAAPSDHSELSVPLDMETINRNNLALVFTARKYSENICLVTSLDTMEERPINDLLFRLRSSHIYFHKFLIHCYKY